MLIFERPEWLWGLVLPALALLAWLRRGRPVERWIGTLALLEESAQERARAHRRRPRPPAWSALAALAAAACLVGLARPASRASSDAATVEVVIVADRRLTLDAAGQGAQDWRHDPSGTRLGAGLERALEELPSGVELRLNLDDGRVLWRVSAAGAATGESGARSPLDLPQAVLLEALSACSRAESSGAAAALRRSPSGAPTVFICAAPPELPGSAPAGVGYVVAGGAAAPGPVARLAEGDLVWRPDGGAASFELMTTPGGRVRRVELDPELPPALADLARAWAAARALSVVAPSQPDPAGEPPPRDVALELVAFDGPPHPARGGRDGFVAALEPATLVPSRAAPAGAAWLDADEGTALVRSSPGRVAVAAGDWRIEGDPLAFATAFAELFDGALRTPPDVLPASARVAVADVIRASDAYAGAGRDSAGGDSAGRRRRYVSLLAALACVGCALAALLRVAAP